MKYYVLVILMLVAFISGMAQDQATVSGKIIEKETGISLPYVTIILKKNQMTLL